MNKTCFFIGHRDPPSCIQRKLNDAVEQHITSYGVTDFFVGNYGGFDHMAAHAVREAKLRHPAVKLYLLLAYLPTQGRIALDGFDGTLYPEGMERVPPKLAILQCNRRMIQESAYLIAYVTHSWGGASKALAYAQIRCRKGELSMTNVGVHG